MDMNQISLACLMMDMNMRNSNEVREDLVRHMILNSVRMYRMDFHQEFGEIVLTYDSKHYWRRDYFPNYKQNRKKGREKDSRDWDAIFNCLNKIKAEFKENLPYKYMEVHGCEADDIIAVVNEYRATNPTLIISSDKDFIQLQKFQGLEQWSPLTKDFVRGNPEESLWEKCIKGDVGDGVPNILSSDDTLITEGKRQRPISKKKMELWKTDRSTWTDEMHRNFNRNETMVDLSKTPESIRINIINQYKEQTPQHGRLMDYFVEKRLKNLMEHIEEFE